MTVCRGICMYSVSLATGMRQNGIRSCLCVWWFPCPKLSFQGRCSAKVKNDSPYRHWVLSACNVGDPMPVRPADLSWPLSLSLCPSPVCADHTISLCLPLRVKYAQWSSECDKIPVTNRQSKNTIFTTDCHTRFWVGIWIENPCMLEKPRLWAASSTNDQRIQGTLVEHGLRIVVFEGQNTVLTTVPGHTRFLAGIWPVDPCMLGKPRLWAASSTKDWRIWSAWLEFRLHAVVFEVQNTV